MPVLKPISGHSRSVRAAIAYLTRGGRSLASDYLSCEEVDLLGRPTWRQICGSFQVAIYYHDDNEGHVPHAHLVVNNANLDRPGRVSTMLTPDFEARMYAGLQRMASERGLRAFNQEGVSARPDAAGPAPEVAGTRETERPRRTRQRTYRSKQDSELEARGISWKRDVRDRMACALRLSSTEEEFIEACRALGLRVDARRGRGPRASTCTPTPRATPGAWRGRRSGSDFRDALREPMPAEIRSEVRAAMGLARALGHLPDERDRVDGPRRPASARAGGRRQAPLYANAFDTASITSTERPSLTEAHSARGKGAQRGRGKGR